MEHQPQIVIEKLDLMNVIEVQEIRVKIQDNPRLLIIFELMIQSINNVINKE